MSNREQAESVITALAAASKLDAGALRRAADLADSIAALTTQQAAIARATDAAKTEYDAKSAVLVKQLEDLRSSVASDAEKLRASTVSARAELQSVNAQLEQANTALDEIRKALGALRG